MVELEQGPQQHHVLTVTSLYYKESVIEYVHVGIGVGRGCVVLGVSVVTVVIGRFWYKRNKKAAERARRRAESVANSVCFSKICRATSHYFCYLEAVS